MRMRHAHYAVAKRRGVAWVHDVGSMPVKCLGKSSRMYLRRRLMNRKLNVRCKKIDFTQVKFIILRIQKPKPQRRK